MKSITQIN